jgi:hypothetical protein
VCVFVCVLGRHAKDAVGRQYPPTLTPSTLVRIGWSKQFTFEYSGRWGCDVVNWVHGVERQLWDLQVCVTCCWLTVSVCRSISCSEPV